MVSVNVRPVTPPNADISKLNGDELVEAVKDWFFDNFEDPVENTPYDSREGGYQYIWGGPYETHEIIADHFPGIPEDVAETIIQELERTTNEWTVSDRRLYDEDPPEPSPYEDIQSALDRLEDALRQVHPFSSAIGGNHPPDEIGVPPYRDEDKRSIVQAIEILRAPEQELDTKPEEVEKAAEELKTVGEKLVDYLKQQGEHFSESFSKEVGKRAAQGIVFLGVWQVLAGRLLEAYEAVKAWLSLLHSPF